MLIMLVLVTILLLKFDSGTAKPARPGYQSYNKFQLSDTNADGTHNVHYDHAAILGSGKIEREFDKLTPSRAIRRLRLMVKNIDSDGNGFVTKEELTKWVRASFRNFEREEALTDFVMHDRDQDWRVSWKEYLHLELGYQAELVDNGTISMEQFNKTYMLMESSKIRFDAADTDRDGYLNEREYVAFEYPSDFKYMHDVEVALWLKDMDQDHDGKISMTEFVGPPHVDPKYDELDRNRFKGYDKNGDGYLDKAELVPWILLDTLEAAKEEAEHLMWVGDEDRDGQLSIDEFLDHTDNFVGSHAFFPREDL